MSGELGCGARTRAVALCGFVPSVLLGCFAPPPELRTRDRIPPYVIVSQVSPAPFVLLSVSPGSVVPLTVPFRSEDAGESLTAALYVDFSPRLDPEDVNAELALTDIPASIFDAPRDVAFDWSVPDTGGCHSLTLILTHASNFSLENLRPLDDAEAAFVTWWLDITQPGSPQPHLLTSCPG